MEICSFGLELYLPMVTILIKEIGISVLEMYWARRNVVKLGLCTARLDPSLKKGVFELDLCLTKFGKSDEQTGMYL